MLDAWRGTAHVSPGHRMAGAGARCQHRTARIDSIGRYLVGIHVLVELLDNVVYAVCPEIKSNKSQTVSSRCTKTEIYSTALRRERSQEGGCYLARAQRRAARSRSASSDQSTPGGGRTYVSPRCRSAKALFSGFYLQGRGNLGSFCCIIAYVSSIHRISSVGAGRPDPVMPRCSSQSCRLSAVA
eukprot:1573745-Rhodomonas_salina.2